MRVRDLYTAKIRPLTVKICAGMNIDLSPSGVRSVITPLHQQLSPVIHSFHLVHGLLWWLQRNVSVTHTHSFSLSRMQSAMHSIKRPQVLHQLAAGCLPQIEFLASDKNRIRWVNHIFLIYDVYSRYCTSQCVKRIVWSLKCNVNLRQVMVGSRVRNPSFKA